MQAIEIPIYGDPSVLRLVERPVPTPASGEVLIRVTASGVNRPDVLQRKGFYAPPPGASDIPGLEVSGVIESGDEVAMHAAGLMVGSRVCALLTGGGYAQWCVAPVGQCLPVPNGWSDVEAACIPETLFTVWSNLFNRAGLQSGETVLIHGGSSGIGVMAIQLARAMGVRVIVTAGSVAKCNACLKLGAELAINYKTHDFVTEVLAYTKERGVDVVLDMVAGAYIERDINCMASDGRLVIIAVQGGVKSQINSASVLLKRLTITGSTLRAQSASFKAAIAQELKEKVWSMLTGKKIQPVIDSVFSAVDAVKAHERIESRQHIGKIVLTW
jgi:NADPH:quinone reductase